MGFMTKFMGDKINTAQAGGAVTVADGNHNLDAGTFLNPGDGITPMNGGRFVGKEFRTIPICGEARGFTADEADAITEEVAANEHRAKHAVRAFNALARNEKTDADVQVAHRKYLGAVAGATLRKVQSNAQLGKTLHQLRPAYAALGLGFQEAERSATNRVNCLKAKIAGAM